MWRGTGRQYLQSSRPNRSWSYFRWPSSMSSSKTKETVIVKFKSMKQKWKMLIHGKNLCNNSENLNQLKFAGKLESMCHQNHQLPFKCSQLKNAVKTHYAWFWNNIINVKRNERSQPAKIYHIIDIKKTSWCW